MVKKVFVYSSIPKLAEQLTSRVPEIEFHNVPVIKDYQFFLQKVVSEPEVRDLQDAQLLVTDAHLLHQFCYRLPNVKWVQLTYAGVDLLIKAARKNGVPKFPITRCSSFQHQLVEYALVWVINHQRNYTKIPELQVTKDWHGFRAMFPIHVPTVRDLTIGILGVGQIGLEVAKAFKFLGSKVIGYGRSAVPREGSPLDEYWYGNDLNKVLEQADYIVCVLPGTPSTKHMLGGDALKATKKNPVLMNIGRGELISDEDILKALDKKWISGAILDVFEFEPLKKESPLWDHPDVIVTPHVAAKPSGGDIVRAFEENYERFYNNKALVNQINFKEGY